MSMNRRMFVRAGGLAMVSMGLDPIFLTRAAYARTNASRKTLICVFQRGAVDLLDHVLS